MESLKQVYANHTTGEDEVWGAQEYVGKRSQETKIHQICKEAESHHRERKTFKNIETCQHTCRELDTLKHGETAAQWSAPAFYCNIK